MRDDKRVAGRLPPLGSIRIPDDFTVAEAHCSLGRVPARPAHRVTVKYDRATEVAARPKGFALDIRRRAGIRAASVEPFFFAGGDISPRLRLELRRSSRDTVDLAR